MTVKDYGHALANDADYAVKAARISLLTKDLSELLPEMVAALKPKLRPTGVKRLADRLGSQNPVVRDGAEVVWGYLGAELLGHRAPNRKRRLLYP